jgi:hypothetical protein
MPGARSAIAMGGADVMTFVRSLRPGFPKGLKVRFFFSPLHHRLILREGTAPPAFKNQSLTIKYPFSHHQVVLVTEDETTFSESKEVLESLCYEGERIVSSHVVVTRAFTKRIFRLNFGYARSCFLDFSARFIIIIASLSRDKDEHIRARNGQKGSPEERMVRERFQGGENISHSYVRAGRWSEFTADQI